MNSANDIELIFRGVSSVHTFNSFEGIRSFFTSSLSDLEQHFRGNGKMHKDTYAESEAIMCTGITLRSSLSSSVTALLDFILRHFESREIYAHFSFK